MVLFGRTIVYRLLLVLCCFFQCCRSSPLPSNCQEFPAICKADTRHNASIPSYIVDILIKLCFHMRNFSKLCVDPTLQYEVPNDTCSGLLKINSSLPLEITQLLRPCSLVCPYFQSVCKYIHFAGFLNKFTRDTKNTNLISNATMNTSVYSKPNPTQNTLRTSTKIVSKVSSTSQETKETSSQQSSDTDLKTSSKELKILKNSTESSIYNNSKASNTNQQNQGKLPQFPDTNSKASNTNQQNQGKLPQQFPDTNSKASNTNQQNLGKLPQQFPDTNSKASNTNQQNLNPLSQSPFYTNSEPSNTNQLTPAKSPQNSLFGESNSRLDYSKTYSNIAMKKNSSYNEAPSSAHFMGYFLTAIVLCIAGYIVFHNKQKIIAFIIEGRNHKRGRRPNASEYKKLQTNVDEVMVSLDKSTTAQNYIY